jgi:hypothetical protein
LQGQQYRLQFTEQFVAGQAARRHQGR